MVALGAGVVAAAFIWFGQPPAEAPKPDGAAAPHTPFSAGPAPTSAKAPPNPAAATAVQPPATSGQQPDALYTALDSAALAERSTMLIAKDRRAWRLQNILGDAYNQQGTVVSAVAQDGTRRIVRGGGQVGGDDVLVVRRNDGTIYIGWLIPGVDDEVPLADAEKPAQRIENVVGVAVEKEKHEERAPASLAIVVSGKTLQTIGPDDFAAAATIIVKDERKPQMAAIDLQHAFVKNAQVASVESDGVRVELSPPSKDARPVIVLNRRKRFKFVWVDAAGNNVGGPKLREISQVFLRE